MLTASFGAESSSPRSTPRTSTGTSIFSFSASFWYAVENAINSILPTLSSSVACAYISPERFDFATFSPLMTPAICISFCCSFWPRR